MQNSSQPATPVDGTSAASATASSDGSSALTDVSPPPARTDAPDPTRAVPIGLAGRIYRLRAEQAALDGETRMRRLLIGLLIIQVPVVVVMLLSSAFVALVVDVIAVSVQIVAAQVFGPHDGDRHVPARDEAMDQLVAGQRAELVALQERADRAEAAGAMLADLARRHRALLVRQLTKIDELEAREADPTALGDLFALDHLATRMRRCSEGVLVLSGRDEIKTGGAPVVASEVLRGAVAEIEDFSRVEVTLDRDVTLVGAAVVDVVHLLAEIIENATVFSSPGTSVRVHGHAAGDAFAVSVVDEGVGMSPERLAELNRFLAEDDLSVTTGQIGFQVVARLAARHGIYVGLAAPAGGGTEATVVLPAALLADGPAGNGASSRATGIAAPRASSEVVVPAAGVPDGDALLERELAAALADESAYDPPAYDPPAYDPSAYDPLVYDEPSYDPPSWTAAPEPVAGSVAYGVQGTSWDEPVAPAIRPVDEWTEWPVEQVEQVEPAPYVEEWAAAPVEEWAAEPAAVHDAYATTDDVPAPDQPFVSYEQQYAAQADLPAPTWDDLAWSTPAAPPAVPVAEPEAWRETTQSPFVPAARVVEETAAPAARPEHHDAAPAYDASSPDDAEDVTSSGLQRRVPLANMAPRMIAPSPVLADDTVAEPAPDRSRHLFSAYRDGLTLGRGGLSSELPAAENIEQQHGRTQPGEGDD